MYNLFCVKALNIPQKKVVLIFLVCTMPFPNHISIFEAILSNVFERIFNENLMIIFKNLNFFSIRLIQRDQMKRNIDYPS